MKEHYLLNRLAEIPEPRDLGVLPDWIDSASLDRLIQDGLITFSHLQRNKGVISLIMGIRFTPKAELVVKPRRRSSSERIGKGPSAAATPLPGPAYWLMQYLQHVQTNVTP